MNARALRSVTLAQNVCLHPAGADLPDTEAQ